MRNIITICCLLITGLVIAQNKNVGNTPVNNVFSNNLDFFALQKVDNVVSNGVSDGMEGSPYLFGEWPEGTIHTKSTGAKSYTLPVNYNVVRDRFEVRVNGEQYALNPATLEKIQTGDRIFVPRRLHDKRYSEIHVDGSRAKLVSLFNYQVVEAPTKTLGVITRQLKIREKKWLLLPDGALVKLPKSTRKLFKILELDNKNKERFSDHKIRKMEDLREILGQS